MLGATGCKKPHTAGQGAGNRLISKAVARKRLDTPVCFLLTLPWDIVYMPHARFKATFGSKIQYMDAIYYFCTTFAGYEVP